MTGWLTVVIVNYNSGEHLRGCLRSLQRDRLTATCEVVVVDSASTDGSLDCVGGRDPRIRLIPLAANRGFGAACNVGVAACATPFVLILNPDTEIADGDSQLLVDRMRGHSRIGLVGCRLAAIDGRVQLSIRNFPSVWRELCECLFLHRVAPRVLARHLQTVRDARDYAFPHAVDWVSGAALLVRVASFKVVGGFDEDFFLYAEEIDLSKRLRDSGWETWYDPALTITHVGGEYSTDPALAVENQRSKLHYFRKHHGKSAMLAFAGVIGVRLALRWLLFQAAGAARRDPLLRARARAAAASIGEYPRLVLGFARGRGPVRSGAGARLRETEKT